MATRHEIVEFCSTLLESERYQDIAHNGLQIEGRDEIERIAVAVSCNQRTIDAAIDYDAGALLVHHGLILGNGIGPIHGTLRHRLRALLCNDINLIGYHLPLDGHPELGNNAQLCDRLDLRPESPFAEIAGMPIGIIATTEAPASLHELGERVTALTGQRPIILPGGPEQVSRAAVVSGSGYSALAEAVALGCEVLITGDVREPTMADARELSISIIVAGHEATERLGVQALAERLRQQFGVEYRFINDPNPV
jgi:dinuclear metal center YbgI/SA1388 family protein